MIKKILPLLFILVMSISALFSCKKVHIPTGDITLNYFPLHLGNYIVYNVDSIYWNEASCDSYNVQTYMKYAITDTFRDNQNRLSYIMNVYTSNDPNGYGYWIPQRVIYLTYLTQSYIPSTVTTSTPVVTTTGLLYNEDGNQYVKLSFPIENGGTWQGNQYIVNDTANQWLQNWTYSYSNYHLSYDNGYINKENTVTVLEDNESYNYLNVDSQVYGYRIYSEDIYAYNIGMIYRQFTHWTHDTGDNTTCKNGYQVIMKAVSYQINNN